MYPLDNQVQEYAWGSRTAIADLLGRPSPSPRPQAELWLGAHPRAPSRVLRNETWQSLFDVISADPEAALGTAVVAQFGAALPFLFKVLAAETPLSLQAHPDAEQARAGFEREEIAGVPLDAPHRNYRDRSHKPELLCALGPFDVLSGFRRAADTARLFEQLSIGPLATATAALVRRPDSAGLRDFFEGLISGETPARSDIAAATIDACTRHLARTQEFRGECEWALRIGALYPGDVGIAVALMLNLITLRAGDAIYLPAGNLHAYLGGLGIEIMANSDNVIRGGLTPKHVDVTELLRVLTFRDGPIEIVRVRDGADCENVYETPAAEFRLSRVDVSPARAFRAQDRGGPEILLAIEGQVTIEMVAHPSQTLNRGASVFVPAADGVYTIRGSGRVFRATVGRF